MRLGTEEDLGTEEQPDLDTGIGPCEPGDPLCERVEVVAPFPLQRDPMPNPAESDSGIERNGNQPRRRGTARFAGDDGGIAVNTRGQDAHRFRCRVFR